MVVNCPSGALAHLDPARAYAIQTGLSVGASGASPGRDRRKQNLAQKAPLQPDALAKARSAYQDFFTLWKDADPNIPILRKAKAEYAKLP